MKKNKRFEVLYEENTGILSSVTILRDRKTGVQYLSCITSGSPGGMTVLLDKDGKPLMDFIPVADDETLADNGPLIDLRTN